MRYVEVTPVCRGVWYLGFGGHYESGRFVFGTKTRARRKAEQIAARRGRREASVRTRAFMVDVDV